MKNYASTLNFFAPCTWGFLNELPDNVRGAGWNRPLRSRRRVRQEERFWLMLEKCMRQRASRLAAITAGEENPYLFHAGFIF